MSAHMAIYAVGNLGQRLIGFIMLPIYTRKLTPEDYGIYELLSITTGILGIMLGVGIRSAVIRFYHRYDSIEEKNAVVSTATLFMSLAMALVFGLLMLSAPLFDRVILAVPEGTYYFRLIFVAFCLQRVSDVTTAYFQVEERSTLVVTLSLLRLVLGLSLNILFVVVYGMGVEGVLLSAVATAVFSFLVGMTITLRRAGARLEWGILLPMLRFGLPLVPAALSYLVINFGDRYFLKRHADLDTIGIYALAYKFGMLISVMVGDPFHRIWSTRSMQLLKAGDKKAVVRVFDAYSLVIVWGWVGLSLLIGDVMAVVIGEKFRAAEHLVPVLGFAYVLRSFADFFAIPITYAYQTKRIAAIRITAAILCLGLYAVLIPRWTTFGAAYATVGVFAYLLFLLYRFGQRATRHDYHVGSLLRVVLVAAVVIVASRSLDMHPGWLRLGTMSLITLAFPFVAAPRETLSLVHEARGKLTAWRGRAS